AIAVHSKSRNLDVQIRKSSHHRERRAPLIDRALRALREHSGVYEDHSHVGKCLNEFDGIGRLSGINLQFKVEVVFLEERETATEISGIAEVGARHSLAYGFAVPVKHLAHTAQIGKLPLGF